MRGLLKLMFLRVLGARATALLVLLGWVAGRRRSGTREGDEALQNDQGNRREG